jgi:hypothetical protein
VEPAWLLPWLPGALLLATPLRRRLDAGSLAAHVVGCSLAFWMAVFWLLPWLGIGLAACFRTASGAAIAACAALAWRARGAPGGAADWRALAAAAALAAAVFALRAWPLALGPAPAGADMSMHTYLTQLILRADGVPSSYRPILPIDSFATFPVGFHTLAALVAELSLLPAYRAAFWLSAGAHALLSLTLFALARSTVGTAPALLAAFVFSFLVKEPQYMVLWGGNPTVMAIAFAALFAATLARFSEWDAWDVLLAAASLAALLLLHTIVFVQSCYAIGLPFAAQQLASGRLRSSDGLARAGGLALATLLLVLPYLAGFDPGVVTPEVREWIRGWVRDTAHAWQGTLADAAWTIPGYVLDRHGDRLLVYTGVAALGTWRLCHAGRPLLWQQLGMLAALFALVLNTRYWVLPLSYLVYPERTAAMTSLPLAVLFGHGLVWLWESRPLLARLPAALRLAGVAAAALAVALLVQGGVRRYFLDRYVNGCIAESSVTPADLEAIAWLAAHARPDDVVVTNYGDAGAWIPGIAFLAVTAPHVNVAYEQAVALPREGRFAYVGAKCVYRCPHTAESLAADPRWRLAFERGGARVFERAP